MIFYSSSRVVMLPAYVILNTKFILSQIVKKIDPTVKSLF